MSIRNLLLGSVFAAGLLSLAGAAQATTLFLGVEPGSTGPITTLATDSGTPGTASYTAGGTFSGLTVKSLTASEVSPAPNINSNTMDVTAALSSGTTSLFISEIDQTASVQSFASIFGVTGFNTGVNGTAMSVMESTYATPCAGGVCSAADVFSTGQLLSTTTFSSTGSVTKNAAANADLKTGQYVVTEVYDIDWQTFSGADHGNITASIDLAQTPLPAAFPLFAAGLGMVGFLAGRRKQKGASQQAIA